MSAYQKNHELAERLARRGIVATLTQANALRLIQSTLHRWSELECGDGNDCASWAIERDTDSYIKCNQCGETTFVDADKAASANCPKCGDCAPLKRHVATDLPYMVTYPHSGESHRRQIADREKGALARAAVLCKELGCHFYYQTDPRGCALYVSAEPFQNDNYTNGVAVY